MLMKYFRVHCSAFMGLGKVAAFAQGLRELAAAGFDSPLGMRVHMIPASPCAAPPLGRVLRRYGHGPGPGSPRCAP